MPQCLLNGKSPDFFVGHVDEFDNSFIWQQELLVHPGTYQMTVTWWGDDDLVRSGDGQSQRTRHREG